MISNNMVLCWLAVIIYNLSRLDKMVQVVVEALARTELERNPCTCASTSMLNNGEQPCFYSSCGFPMAAIQNNSDRQEKNNSVTKVVVLCGIF